ncbi:MAG: hypothetical protein MUC54_09225, partial [Chloroflexi bacterium]|nr:hypothetical protein [Chloroflexota bacterium]
MILCDFETAGAEGRAVTDGVLDPRAGSAAGVLRVLLDDPGAARLNPILVSGRTVACTRATATALVAFARGGWTGGEEGARGHAGAPGSDAELADVLAGWDPLEASTPAAAVLATRGPAATPATSWDDVVVIAPADPRWTPRRWVPLVTRYFEAGGSRCLVGTRGLLGEGWN